MTCEMPSRWLRLTWSPATGSALAVKAVRTKVPRPVGWRSLVHEWVRGDGPVAAAAAGSVGIGMEDDADAGDRLVEFRQVHRDVVGDEAAGVLMWTKRGGSMSKPVPVFGVLTLRSSTGWSLKSLPRALSRKRCSSTHRSTSASADWRAFL